MTRGVTGIYGVGPSQSTPRFNGREWNVNYPPLSLYELDVVGHLYRYANNGRFPDTPALTMTMKTVPVVFEIGIVVLFWAAVRRLEGEVSG